MSMRFGTRRNVIGELVLLPENSSPKPNKRLRHALFYLTFGQGVETRGLRYREPVMAAPETRRERRARMHHDKLAAEALAKKVRDLDLNPPKPETPTVPQVQRPTPMTGLRKMTGAVRRGLARGKKA